MLNSLHGLGGTNGNTIDGELEPSLQWVRREGLVKAVHRVEVVIRLLDVFAMKTCLGHLGVEGRCDFEFRGEALVGF
jgi:hypothetical protein